MAQAIDDLKRSRQLYPDDVSAREIEEDIEHTRSAMDDTVSELFYRLAPRQLFADVIGIIRESMRGGRKRKRRYDDEYEDDEPGLAKRAAGAVGRKVVDTVKEHPVPAALITAGVVWMMVEDDRSTRKVKRQIKRLRAETPMPVTAGYVAIEADYGGETGMRGGEHGLGERAREAGHAVRERVGEAAHSVREGAHRAAERAGEWAERTRDRVTDAGEYISERAHDVGDTMREGYRKTRETYERAMDEYPLAVGLAAVALGVVAGLAIPRTRAENRMFGETSEHVKDRGREMGREMMERGGEVAEHAVVTAAKEAGKEVFGSEHDEHEHDEPQGGSPQQSGERFRGTEI